mmetsp:Transcript_116056/g.205478  ORF Transcript_116056/g.205478 Transcript_116056/m.205478 type:complete len:295 (-) Transcript_116056:661-1545(-)
MSEVQRILVMEVQDKLHVCAGQTARGHNLSFAFRDRQEVSAMCLQPDDIAMARTAVCNVLAQSVSNRHEFEFLPISFVRPARLDFRALNINVASMKRAQEHGLAPLDMWIGRSRMEFLLEWILSATYPLRQLTRGACEQTPSPCYLVIPLWTCVPLAPVPEERAMGGIFEGVQLRKPQEMVHLILRHRAAGGPCGASQCEAPLTDHHGIAAQHLAILIHVTHVLSQRFAVHVVLEALVAVDIKADIPVLAIGERQPLLCKLVFTPLKDRKKNRHSAGRHSSRTDELHCLIVIAA